MRYFIIVFLLSYSSFLLGQKTTVFQEANTGRYYQESELGGAMAAKLESYKKVFPQLTITFQIKITEEIIRNDSLVKVFEWKESGGNLEKVYEYKGKEFPAYEFTRLDGSSFKLSDLEGKPVFIDLWFTNCKPCIKKFPDLNKIARKYNKDVHFVAITFDSAKDVEKLLKKFPLNFIHIVDAKPFLKEIGQQLYPKNVLLSESGKVIFVSESFEPLDKKEMEKMIEAAL